MTDGFLISWLKGTVAKLYLAQDVDEVTLFQSQLILIRSLVGKCGFAVLFCWGRFESSVRDTRTSIANILSKHLLLCPKYRKTEIFQQTHNTNFEINHFTWQKCIYLLICCLHRSSVNLSSWEGWALQWMVMMGLAKMKQITQMEMVYHISGTVTSCGSSLHRTPFMAAMLTNNAYTVLIMVLTGGDRGGKWSEGIGIERKQFWGVRSRLLQGQYGATENQ